MNKIKIWSPVEQKKIIHIGLTNRQISYILEDKDIIAFYHKICKGVGKK